jgi:hypothetical protein
MIAAVFVMLCREDGFLFFPLALLSSPKVRFKDKRWMISGLLSVAAFLTYVLLIQPAFGNSEATQTLMKQNFQNMGTTPLEIVAYPFLHPIHFVSTIVSTRKLEYLLALFAPVAFLPLLAPRYLIPSLWPLVLNFLRTTPSATSVVDSHYSALAAPVIIAATVTGLSKLRRQRLPGFMLVGASLLSLFLWGAVPGSRNFFPEDYRWGGRVEVIREMIQPIRDVPDASCTLPVDVVAHLAQRPQPAYLPYAIDRSEFVLFDFDPPTSSSGYRPMLNRMYASLMEQREMELVSRRGNFILLKRLPD